MLLLTVPAPSRLSRLRRYLHRLLTCWVAEDPDPTYSAADEADGLTHEKEEDPCRATC